MLLCAVIMRSSSSGTNWRKLKVLVSSANFPVATSNRLISHSHFSLAPITSEYFFTLVGL